MNKGAWATADHVTLLRLLRNVVVVHIVVVIMMLVVMVILIVLVVVMVVLTISVQQSQKRYMVSGSLCPLISFLDISDSVSFVVRGQRPRWGQ